MEKQWKIKVYEQRKNPGTLLDIPVLKPRYEFPYPPVRSWMFRFLPRYGFRPPGTINMFLRVGFDLTRLGVIFCI